jgi:stalled ribosome alternative rescue factor ArfA
MSNQALITQIKKLCRVSLERKLKGMSCYLSKEERDNEESYLEGQHYLAAEILHLIINQTKE